MANVVTLSTIAALRSNTAALGTVYLTGYYSLADGGQGTFVYASSDTTSVDNGGTIIVDAAGQRWYREVDDDISILWFGARVDGSHDDSSFIQNAIDWMESGSSGPYGAGLGGKLHFPPGTTLINSGITLSKGGVTLQGAGWEENIVLGVTHGSYILTTSTAQHPITIAYTTRHCAIQDLAFAQVQPADAVGWTPTIYPSTIYIVGNAAASGAVLLERVFCWNCYYFIQVGSSGNATGRVTMKHIWGMPLSTGIVVNFSADTLQIDDVHFWQFQQGVPNIVAWVQAHGVAFRSYRNDNPFVSNFFAYGYNVGLQFSASADGTISKFHGENLDLDGIHIGIQFLSINGGIPSAQIVNLTHQGPGSGAGPAADCCVLVAAGASGVILDICNLRSSSVGGNVLNIQGPGTDVAVTNLWADNWNTSNTSAAVVNVASGATVTLSGRLRQNGGNGAGVSSGSGTLNSSHVN